MRVARCTFSQTEYRIAEKIGVDRLPLGGNFIEVQGVVEGAASIFEQSGESAMSSRLVSSARSITPSSS